MMKMRRRNRKICFAFIACMMLVCSGCLPLTGYGYHPANFDSETLAKKTLDIAYSSPDLTFYAHSKDVLNFLTVLGADNEFPDKSKYMKRIRSIYQWEGIIGPMDNVLLYNDGINGWVNIMVIKENEGKTLLWMRKPRCCGFKPTPDSPFNKDWLAIIMRECAARNIRVER